LYFGPTCRSVIQTYDKLFSHTTQDQQHGSHHALVMGPALNQVLQLGGYRQAGFLDASSYPGDSDCQTAYAAIHEELDRLAVLGGSRSSSKQPKRVCGVCTGWSAMLELTARETEGLVLAVVPSCLLSLSKYATGRTSALKCPGNMFSWRALHSGLFEPLTRCVITSARMYACVRKHVNYAYTHAHTHTHIHTYITSYCTVYYTGTSPGCACAFWPRRRGWGEQRNSIQAPVHLATRPCSGATCRG